MRKDRAEKEFERVKEKIQELSGIEEYSYQKDGETVKGYQFTYEKSFPKNNKKNVKKEG